VARLKIRAAGQADEKVRGLPGWQRIELTLALMITIFCRAATAAAAFPSCCSPRPR
jgi:hypothetical protein